MTFLERVEEAKRTHVLRVSPAEFREIQHLFASKEPPQPWEIDLNRHAFGGIDIVVEDGLV